MITFSLKKPSASNYTPRGLIFEIAKAGRLHIVDLDKYGTVGLILNGRAYGYDHWEIAPDGNGQEIVTVYLADKVAAA
jgi:hypothetical protein